MSKILFLLIITIIFQNITIKSKITRKHKHPGSEQSSNSDITIEPLTKPDLNENLNNININSNTNNNQEQIIQLDNKEEIKKQANKQNYYNEDDEFVYGHNIQQNKNIKDDSLLDLDQELKKRQENQIYNSNSNQNQNIIHNNNNINNNINNNENKNNHIHDIDPEKERFIKEQREKTRKQHNPYNPRPHQQKVITSDNLNHGRNPGPGSHGPKPPVEQNQVNQPSRLRKLLSLFYQIMMIFFFVSFIYNYFLGKNQNDKHALVWYNSNKEYFEERYEYFGVEDDDKLKKPKRNTISLMKDCKLTKENPYYYKLSCANYRYIRYLTVVLEFHKRYDMTSILTSIFISPKDRLVFQVSFEPVENTGWIFCVSRKSQSKSLKKSYEDLNYFCEVYEPSSFNNYMCLISESLEMFMELFNNKSLFQYYKCIENYLEAIYYSDMISSYVEGNNIFFSFNIDLTRPNQDRKLLEITHFVNLFVDTLAQLKYNKEFKEKVKNNRIMFERTKMDPNKRKEIEEKEKRDFIERWKLIKLMKTKKGAERRKIQRELSKYQ